MNTTKVIGIIVVLVIVGGLVVYGFSMSKDQKMMEGETMMKDSGSMMNSKDTMMEGTTSMEEKDGSMMGGDAMMKTEGSMEMR